MSETAFARLEGAVVVYLWHSLSCGFPDRVFALDRFALANYASEIQALPNRTPNGVLLPRRDTYLSFNLIHQALAAAFDDLGLLQRFSALQLPCNVRIVSGAPDRSAEQRPYSSTKIHTDVWNGEPISSILFNIPVLGDLRAVDLQFYEPREFPENLRGPLSDYKLGDNVTASGRAYPISLDFRQIYVSDSLSLHRTIKRRPALRLSLDMRGIARELLPGEGADWRSSKAVYVPPNEWRVAGTTTVLGSGQPLDAFQRRQNGEVVTPDALSIVILDNP